MSNVPAHTHLLNVISPVWCDFNRLGLATSWRSGVLTRISLESRGSISENDMCISSIKQIVID